MKITDQSEQRKYLIASLIKENKEYENIEIPEEEGAQRRLLRSLMNIRPAAPVTDGFTSVMDDYLKEVSEEKGVVTISDMDEMQPDLFLWQGDITRLKVGAIVNAANSGMTGCYRPCHNCIDNCIHTYAGIGLRNYCAQMMEQQGYEEPTGQAKITPAFNLPCDHVIHTVGPIVSGGRLNIEDKELLRSCYLSCLGLADENRIKSIAFCCISTGVFGFPKLEAARIAVSTVKNYKESTGSKIKVIFNVFKDEDLDIYRELLR